MHTSRFAVVAVLAVSLVLTGCTLGTEERPGTSRPVGSEPLGDDEVTLHMANPPELPPVLEGAEVTTAELRSTDLVERHIVQLVEVPAETTSLDEALAAGALLRVAAGQVLEIGAAVDVAGLDPDATEDDDGVLGEVGACAAQCSVDGPALVAPEGWMVGFGIASNWQLLVPSPTA